MIELIRLKSIAKIKIVICSLFSLIVNGASAQTSNWVRHLGGSVSEKAVANVVDKAGNTYATGNFSGTVDFDPGPGVFNLTSQGINNIYITKFDTSGKFVWAVHLEGGWNYGNSLLVDNSGNVFLIGDFQHQIDFDPGPGAYIVNANSTSSVFILKLHSSGAFIWVKVLLGVNSAEGSSGAIDGQQNLYLYGTFGGTLDFDPGNGVFELTERGMGGRDLFILKLSPNGDFIWAKSIGGSKGSDGADKLRIDELYNIYLSGWTSSDTMDCDPGPGKFDLYRKGPSINAFIAKLDSSGDLIWAKNYHSRYSTYPAGLAVNKEAVYITGYFSDTGYFNPDSSTFMLVSKGDRDGYVLKLDKDGNFVWVRTMQASFRAEGLDIATDKNGNSYTTGYFTDTCHFGSPGQHRLVSNGFSDVYYLTLDKDGNVIGLNQFGGAGYDEGHCIYASGPGNVHLLGLFQNTVNVDLGADTDTITSAGVYDVFFLKRTLCQKTTSFITLQRCVNYVSPSGKYNWVESGLYTDTIINALGCDSITVINLIIRKVDISVSQVGSMLTATAPNSQYQWIDCQNSNVIISGEQAQSYIPTTNGTYAVIVTQGGCIDTSSCYNVTNVGVKHAVAFGARVYPNPSNGKFIVETTQPCQINISNNKGELVRSELVTDSSYELLLPSNGIYYLQLSTDNSIVTQKLIVCLD